MGTVELDINTTIACSTRWLNQNGDVWFYILVKMVVFFPSIHSTLVDYPVFCQMEHVALSSLLTYSTCNAKVKNAWSLLLSRLTISIYILVLRHISSFALKLLIMRDRTVRSKTSLFQGFGFFFVRFEVSTAVTMMIIIF
jgi:hypothetical protein